MNNMTIIKNRDSVEELENIRDLKTLLTDFVETADSKLYEAFCNGFNKEGNTKRTVKYSIKENEFIILKDGKVDELYPYMKNYTENTIVLDDVRQCSNIEVSEIMLLNKDKNLTLFRNIEEIINICYKALQYPDKHYNIIQEAQKKVIDYYVKNRILESQEYFNDYIAETLEEAFMCSHVDQHKEGEYGFDILYNPIEKRFSVFPARLDESYKDSPNWIHVFQAEPWITSELLKTTNSENDDNTSERELREQIASVISSKDIEYINDVEFEIQESFKYLNDYRA